jgi:DNA-binding CsgD family transcriptional regulator/PAS domain-containing protein
VVKEIWQEVHSVSLSLETERAIELCYDSIAAPQLWTGALDNLAHSLGAAACQILPHELSQRPLGQVRSSHAWRIHERWQKNLDWVTPVYEPRGDPLVRQGYRAVLQSQLFTDEEIRHSRFHQEITRPVGCLHWACGIFQVEDRIWCLPFFRGSEPFDRDILEPIAEIAGRMARVISIAEKVARAGAENEVITLESAGCAALLIDKHGRATRANRRAEELFCNEFGIRNGRLWIAANASLARLDLFMAEIEHAKSTLGPLPAPVIIARRGTPWLLIEAMPVTSASNDIFEGSRAILLVSDLTRPSVTDAARLSLVFGLTGAEARLAAAICEGNDLNAAAATFGVSRQTVRSQLKTIFAKTGSRRQAELVARAAQIRNTTQH